MKSLIAFEATARLGSMTAAADEARATQPTISRRVPGLPTCVCYRYCQRSNRRFRR
ncbi:helix-turn-helix domain-containing protein [Vreelandella subterranea]|uniref:helix-turn-helix domain-containing protein n=1 Tax=Vreelandella subterranea TaxID=416874 RepID=UPI0015875442